MTTPAPELSAADIVSYLASRGWERDEDWRGASVWRLDQRARILVPLSREYEDDDSLLEEAVSRIAKVEERPPRDVRLDISEPNVDVQYFRTYPDAPSGTISLPSGLKAVQGVYDLLKAAANTLERGPELIFEGRNSSLVDTFLRRAMLAAAVPGSYVLTTRVPAGQLAAPRLDTELSGRSIMEGLAKATRAAREAADLALRDRGSRDTETTSDLAWAFSERVSDGVSANLCKALADLGGQYRDRPFDVGFSWGRNISAQNTTESITFIASMPAVLWTAGKELEELAKSGEARITGRVEDLQHRRGEKPRAKIVGELEILRGTELPRRTLWVILNSEQNEQAIRAYRNQSMLEVQGRLTTTSRRLELIVDSFRVLGPG